VINGVDVAPLIEAELDRRHPDRAKMRPIDAAGFRDAWHILIVSGGHRRSGSWFSPAQLNESVNGEWSFIQTIRHLSYATDSWVRRAILGEPSPWHSLDLPPDEFLTGLSFHETSRRDLSRHRDRIATESNGHRSRLHRTPQQRIARRVYRAGRCTGWPPPIRYPVRKCLLVVLMRSGNIGSTSSGISISWTNADR